MKWFNLFSIRYKNAIFRQNQKSLNHFNLKIHRNLKIISNFLNGKKVVNALNISRHYRYNTIFLMNLL